MHVPVQVKCPDDYRCWLESMYSLFGTKWSKLHRGPCWSFEPTEQGRAVEDSKSFSPLSVSSYMYMHTLLVTSPV